MSFADRLRPIYLKWLRRWAARSGDTGADLDIRVGHLRKKIRFLWGGPLQFLCTLWGKRNVPSPMLTENRRADDSRVSRYWGGHSVWAKPILTRRQSFAYLEEITDGRPRKRWLNDLHNVAAGGTVLEYGCGTGNDLTGWVATSKAGRIFAVDVSAQAMELARQRVALHPEVEGRVEFCLISETDPRLPYEDESIDRVNSMGVIHHTSEPQAILEELYRVLKPGAEARIMNYNPVSVRIHLTFGFVMQVRRGDYPGLRSVEAFENHADLRAPIVNCWHPDVWVEMGRKAGFDAAFLGGFFMPGEAESFWRLARQAVADPELATEDREFLEELEETDDGLLAYRGRLAGQGGSYVLRKGDLGDFADQFHFEPTGRRALDSERCR